MKKLLMTTALLIWIGAPAIAQTGSGGSSTAVKDRPTPQAPVGHRQPHASDVPLASSGSLDFLDQEDADVDRKISGVCRGC